MSDNTPVRPRKPAGGTRTAATTLLLGGALATSGCIFGGKKAPPPRVFVAPPVVAKAPPQPVRIELARAPQIDPVLESPSLVAAGTQPAPDVTPPKPVAPVKPPRVEEAATVTPPPVVATPPKPAQIFSPEQQRVLSRQYDEFTQSAKGALALILGRNLTAGQRAEVNDINALLRQAEQARGSDPSTAVEIARRADLLATDLLKRLP